MAISREDTIFALASAPGRAGVAVVRVSGPEAARTADLFGFDLPPPRRAAARPLADGGAPVDRALVLYFAAPASYTGEDTVELHLHGGRAVLDKAVSVLARAPGFRHAEPGEFSRRAVLNGKLDLTAAEAVNDLTAAETEAQRELALRQLDGGLARRFDEWAEGLTAARAHLEAWIDFPDEEIPAGTVNDLAGALAEAAAGMAGFLDDGRRGERLRDGLRIAVVGPPNAGKSSLVNLLAGRDVAIVSERAGTTRDVIEVHLDLGGWPVIVADTAGLRETGDALEAEGARRARDWAERADLRLLVLDAAGEGLAAAEGLPAGDLVLLNKIDLRPGAGPGPGALGVSARTGEGLDAALEALAGLARVRMDTGGRPALTRARHRAALEAALAALRRALDGLAAGVGVEEVAEELRAAADALGRVTGRVDVEDLLDIVFRDFCIGK